MERSREWVTILLNDVWDSAVIDFGCVSYIILWINFTLTRVKAYAVVEYGPNGGDGEGRGIFWNDMDKILDIVANGYRLCILEDLKRKSRHTWCFWSFRRE